MALAPVHYSCCVVDDSQKNADDSQKNANQQTTVGIEPTTFCSEDRCSTFEPRDHYIRVRKSLAYNPLLKSSVKAPSETRGRSVEDIDFLLE